MCKAQSIRYYCIYRCTVVKNDLLAEIYLHVLSEYIRLFYFERTRFSLDRQFAYFSRMRNKICNSTEQTNTFATQKRIFFISVLSCTRARCFLGLHGFSHCPSLAGCTSNRDCPLTEACIGHTCQEPCLVRNPCAEHAICINTNHGADCSCEEGYHGNGFSYCDLREFFARY